MLFPLRVRQLVRERPEVTVFHRCFALAPTPETMVAILDSKEWGKQEVLNHWRAANLNDDEHRINTDPMAQRPFDYPYSMPGLLACKAAEMQGGPAAHWDIFDRAQRAHLTEYINIADFEVLRNLKGLSLPSLPHLQSRIARDLHSKGRLTTRADRDQVKAHGPSGKVNSLRSVRLQPKRPGVKDLAEGISEGERPLEGFISSKREEGRLVAHQQGQSGSPRKRRRYAKDCQVGKGVSSAVLGEVSARI